MRTVLLMSLFCLTSCASIMKGGFYEYEVISNPKGVEYEIYDRDSKKVATGIAPNRVTLKSGHSFFKKQRYTVYLKSDQGKAVIPLEYSVEGWYWGNLFLGGAIGMLIVDPSTGAMYKPKRDNQRKVIGNADISVSVVTDKKYSD